MGIGQRLCDLVRVKVVVRIKGDAANHPDDNVKTHIGVLNEAFAILPLERQKLVHEEVKFVLDCDCLYQSHTPVLVLAQFTVLLFYPRRT